MTTENIQDDIPSVVRKYRELVRPAKPSNKVPYFYGVSRGPDPKGKCTIGTITVTDLRPIAKTTKDTS